MKKKRKATVKELTVKKTTGREPITIERLERALVLCARLIELDGPVAIPWFERVERELAAKRAEQNTVLRAKALLESYGSVTERRAIAPPVA
jgi:hypothetical protein